MIDLLGLCIDDAVHALEEQGIKYRIIETHAPKPLQYADSVRVIRQRISEDAIELTVGYFKTRI